MTAASIFAINSFASLPLSTGVGSIGLAIVTHTRLSEVVLDALDRDKVTAHSIARQGYSRPIGHNPYGHFAFDSPSMRVRRAGNQSPLSSDPGISPRHFAEGSMPRGLVGQP